MNDEREIKLLTEKFFSGETTRHEEKLLYRYFSGKNISEELMPMKDLFVSFGAINNSTKSDSKKSPLRFFALRSTRIAIAAGLTLLIGFAVTTKLNKEQNYCEAYIYSRHVTDPAVVMKEVTGTLEVIHGDDQAIVDNQLRGIFSDIQ